MARNPLSSMEARWACETLVTGHKCSVAMPSLAKHAYLLYDPSVRFWSLPAFLQQRRMPKTRILPVRNRRPNPFPLTIPWGFPTFAAFFRRLRTPKA